MLNNVNFYQAVDAVRNPAGAIVCRSTLTSPTNGCVPYNVLGTDGNSQAAIDYVTTAHAFSKDSTKSILYSANLNQPGRNVGGNIVIGPPAFEQDIAWLSGVVFHELVHSPQHACYVSKGVTQS